MFHIVRFFHVALPGPLNAYTDTINPFPNDTFWAFPNGESFKFDENGIKLSKRVKKKSEKEKSHLTSNFSISHSVFKILLQQTHKNKCLFGKGLIKQRQRPRFPSMFHIVRFFPVRLPNQRFSSVYMVRLTDLPAELSFVTFTIHLCDGLNDKNLVKPRKSCFFFLLKCFMCKIVN